MLAELRHYEIQTLNDGGVWIHHSFIMPDYKYEDRTITRKWWLFGYSYTRRVLVNEKDARVGARKKAMRRARRINKGIPARVNITVRFRGHEGYTSYAIWERGTFLT